MTHLSAGDLVDLGEGTRPESSAPHLEACQTCRAQLAELKAMMSAAAAADVPEPSPLYWDHLSARVRDAVETARVAGPRPTSLRGGLLKNALRSGLLIRALAGVALAAVVALMIVKTLVPAAPPTSVAVQAPPPVDDASSWDVPAAARDDVWLTLVADLAAGVDADAVRDEALDAMNADDAVMHLNDGELRELERLLQAQIRNQGD